MAVSSTMLALGTEAPEFSLPDTVSGSLVSLNDFADRKAMLVMFICNHCPYVQRIREGLAAFGRDYALADLGIVAISANDVDGYPDDSPEAMKSEAETFGYSFPYLYDETQQVARDYTAACTPDFFLFNAERQLVYRGQFDGARPSNDEQVTGADLRAAVDAVLSDGSVADDQKPSLGCNIKWKPGNEPVYFG